MPTVVQTKYFAGASPGTFDNPIGAVGRRLVLFQAGRDTPNAGDVAFLVGQGWTHLATCTNATGFERGAAIYWKSAAATNESWNLDAPDLEYILVETDATVETPVVVGVADTQASSANVNCGGAFTPAEGDDFLAIGVAAVGASDQDYDSLPNPITPYDDVDEGPEPGGIWNSFSPLMWLGWLSDSSASGSYVVGGTNARPRTYCGITILLASSPPPAEITPPFVCILDDEDLSELACINVEDLEDWKIKLELQGTGSGTFTVHRSTAIATDSILKMGNWIAVTIPQIQEDPIFLVQIETIVTTLISEDEEGGEVVVFGGRGPLSYLERVKAYPRSFEGGGSDALSTNGGYLHGPASTGNKAGQILNRSIEEWQSTDRGVADVGRRLQPIKHLTRDFDYTDDSSSAAWATTAMTAELSQGYVGETGLQGVLELIGTGEIDILMWPDLSMQAFNSYGRDLTATDFAADKVIFRRAFNINEALKRSFGPGVVPTDTIVQGEESTWGFASSPMAGSVPDVEGYLSAPGTDTAALEEIGLADMRRRLRQGESVQFQIDVPMFGDEPNPEFGVYLFGPPGSNGQFYLGDTVTLDTGNGFHDFDNDDVRVMAATITHDDAGDLIIIPELKGTKILGRFGATTGTPGGSGFGVGFGSSGGGTGGGTPAPPPPTAILGQHVADPTDAHDASAISVDPTGLTHVSGDDVQEAIEELDAAVGSSGDAAYTVEPQTPHQSRHFLQRDGTWRDPFITGLGTVDSVGSAVTITDDSSYNAWPTICRLTENRVILAYTKASSHHGDNTGRAVVKRGTEDGSGTITWGSEIVAYDHATLWASAMGVARISTGRIFITLFRDNFSDADSGEAGIVYSDDDGATWSAWIPLSIGRDAEYGSGAVLELPDGDLLVPVEGHDVAGDDPLHNDSFVVRSTDRGESWGGAVLVHDFDTDSFPCYESCLVLLPDDTVQIYHRTGASAGSTVKRQESADFGATWGAMTDAWTGYGKANVIQDSTGVLWAVDRQSGTADVVLFSSTDRGDPGTWDAGTVITSAPFEMEYGCPLESLRSGRLLVVWGDQPTSSTSNSDIDYCLVVVDVDEFSSEPTGAAGGDLSGTYPNPSVVDDSHNHTSATLPSTAGVGEIVIASVHSTPLVFDDLVQNSDGDDLVYASA